MAVTIDEGNTVGDLTLQQSLTRRSNRDYDQFVERAVTTAIPRRSTAR